MPVNKSFYLKPEDLKKFESEIKRRNIPKWKHNRFMILLLSHQNNTYKEIEKRLGIVSHTIKKWKDRCLSEGLMDRRWEENPTFYRSQSNCHGAKESS